LPPFISDYMVEKLGIDETKIENLGNLLYKNYGTTMAGLRVRVLQFPCCFELFAFSISESVS
jgi:hypothetical protein